MYNTNISVHKHNTTIFMYKLINNITLKHLSKSWSTDDNTLNVFGKLLNGISSPNQKIHKNARDTFKIDKSFMKTNIIISLQLEDLTKELCILTVRFLNEDQESSMNLGFIHVSLLIYTFKADPIYMISIHIKWPHLSTYKLALMLICISTKIVSLKDCTR